MNIYKLHFGFFLNMIFSFLSFPKSCSYCNSVSYKMALCKRCSEKLIMEIKTKRCKTCGKELFFEDSLCTKCRNQDEKPPLFGEFESVFPIFTYALQKKRLIYLWKTKKNRELGFFFAKILARHLNEKLKNIPIVPVPPRPDKIKTKGFDQIDDLTTILEKKYKIKVCRLLEKQGKLQQKKLSKKDRLLESQKAFLPKTNLNIDEIPKEVVLIDDVITTGATINSCKIALEKLGIKKIHVVSLFAVP